MGVFMSGSGISISDIPDLMVDTWGIRKSLDNVIVFYTNSGWVHNPFTPELFDAVKAAMEFSPNFKFLEGYEGKPNADGRTEWIWIHVDLVPVHLVAGRKTIANYVRKIDGKLYHRLSH